MRTKNGPSFLFSLFLILTIIATPVFSGPSSVFAKGEPDKDTPLPVVEVVNPYYTVEVITIEDGNAIEKGTINGPPKPLPEYEAERQASIQPLPSDGIITSFPSYNWVFGCSAVSGAMIAGYYDRNGYPNMYAGPTNGGLMPLTDTSWVWWSDGYKPYPNNPLIASHNGVDSRTTRGSIDDYWVKYDSDTSDPYIDNWVQHTWSDAIGDFMKTSQSAYNNSDGSTQFYNWNSSSDALTCSEMEYYGIDHLDGTYGRKMFYEARGYTVTDCYNQKTNNVGGGFYLADFQAEIDGGHPVLLNLYGHSIVGYGYSGSTIYVRDTWSSDPGFAPTMTWGGSYSGMALQSVSIVHLNAVSVTPAAPTGVSASDGTFADKVRISWNASSGAANYKIFRNTSNTTAGAVELPVSPISSPYDDVTGSQGVTYYYWVKACNIAGCSGYSSSDSGYILATPSAPIVVVASDGTFSDKVRVTWGRQDSDYEIFLPLILNGGGGPAPIPGEIWYEVYRNTADSTGSALMVISNHPASPYDDTLAVPGTTYYYWVKACNSAGCSGFSPSDSGYRSGEITVPSAPQEVDASNGTYSDRVHLTWAASTGETYYKVFRHTLNNPDTAITLSESYPASPYDDTSAVPGTTYYYWVKACNSAGCSEFSSSDTGWIGVSSLVNGDFEEGHVGWVEYSTHGWDIITPDLNAPVSAHGGSWLAWLGGDYDDTSYVSQSIAIPPGAPYLHYWYWIGSEDSCGWDYFRIKLGSTTVRTKDLCDSQATGGWVEGVENLSAFAGTTENLKFEVTTDGSLNSNLFLDDVSFSGTASAYEGVITPDDVNQDLLNSER